MAKGRKTYMSIYIEPTLKHWIRKEAARREVSMSELISLVMTEEKQRRSAHWTKRRGAQVR